TSRLRRKHWSDRDLLSPESLYAPPRCGSISAAHRCKPLLPIIAWARPQPPETAILRLRTDRPDVKPAGQAHNHVDHIWRPQAAGGSNVAGILRFFPVQSKRRPGNNEPRHYPGPFPAPW